MSLALVSLTSAALQLSAGRAAPMSRLAVRGASRMRGGATMAVTTENSGEFGTTDFKMTFK